MFGLILGFIIAMVVGFRRGKVSGPAVVGIAAISLFLAVLGVVQNSVFNPWAGEPSILRIARAALTYFVPLLGGFALGAVAKKQRLRNDAEADGAT